MKNIVSAFALAVLIAPFAHAQHITRAASMKERAGTVYSRRNGHDYRARRA